jgi:hypothetical protein
LEDGKITNLGNPATRAFGEIPPVHWTPDDTKDGGMVTVSLLSGDGALLAVVPLAVSKQDFWYSLIPPSIPPSPEDSGMDVQKPQIPTGEPYDSAAVAAIAYYAERGRRDSDIALSAAQADYTGDPDMLAKLKDQTVTFQVEFSDDPKSHPMWTIVLTRETGGAWEVVSAD